MNNIMNIARAKAGYRENFAINNGDKSVCYIRGHKCYKFTYSEKLDFQDANGATFDTVIKEWIN